MFEDIQCYLCGADDATPFIRAQEDLTGKPGWFNFSTCDHCGLVYQKPRVDLEHIIDYYDDEYIAHRKRTDWGVLQPIYDWAMGKYDRDKDEIISQYVDLNAQSHVLDVGCAVGTFLTLMQKKYGSTIYGVDFKDCSYYPGFDQINFYQGLFYEQDFGQQRFDLITMWHFLEHDYDPMQSMHTARDLLSDDGRLIIEVPRLDSLTFQLYKERWPGLQAPQHTVIFDRARLIQFAEKAGLEVVDYLPYGAFPPYFYLFTGALFKVLKGKGIDIDQWVHLYFAGQIALAPLLALEKQLNLAMQTIICKRP